MPVKQKDVRFLIFKLIVLETVCFCAEFVLVRRRGHLRPLLAREQVAHLRLDQGRPTGEEAKDILAPNLVFFKKIFLIICSKSIAVAPREWQVYPADAFERPLRPDLLHRSQREPHRRGQQGQVGG